PGASPSAKGPRSSPRRTPSTSRPSATDKSGAGSTLVVGSAGSYPAMAPSISAQSATVRAIGPAWSIDHASGSTPARLTRPYVGLMPLIPQSEAGMRIEPPVSEPSAAGASAAAIATPEPDDDPPAMRWVPASHGFTASP